MTKRKTSRSAAARAAATERAARFMEREQDLVKLAADVLDAGARLDEIGGKYAERRAALEAEQHQEEAAVRQEAGRSAARMIGEYGVTKTEAAERLGISLHELNETLAAAPPGKPEPSTGHRDREQDGPDLLDADQADNEDSAAKPGPERVSEDAAQLAG